MPDKKITIISLAIFTLCLLSSCSHNKEITKLENEITQLEQQITEVKRANAEYNIRIEKLITEISLLKKGISPEELAPKTADIETNDDESFPSFEADKTMSSEIQKPAEIKPLSQISPTGYLEPIETMQIIQEENSPIPHPSTSPSAIVTAPKTPEPPTVKESKSSTNTDLQLYIAGYDYYSRGDFEKAEGKFNELIISYPNSDYSDNAQYWIGECYYDQKDYSKAIVEFKKVKDNFPKGNKVPDSLLKLGFCFFEIGETSQGKKILDNLIKNYPDSESSKTAHDKLKSMSFN